MKCPECNGSGVIVLLTSSKPCEACGGVGAPLDFSAIEKLFADKVVMADQIINGTTAKIRELSNAGTSRTSQAEIKASLLKFIASGTVTKPAALDQIGKPDPMLIPKSYVPERMLGAEETKRMREAFKKEFSGARRGCIVPAPDPTLGVSVSPLSDADLFQYAYRFHFDLSPDVYMTVTKCDRGWMAQRMWHHHAAPAEEGGGYIIPPELMAKDFAGYDLSHDGWATPPATGSCDKFFFADVRDILKLVGWKPPETPVAPATAPAACRVSLDISLECDAENADTLIEMLKGPRFVLHGLQTRTMPRWTPPATEGQ